MFCPNCGTNNSIEQNFCRFCGLEFQQIADSLASQLASGSKERQFRKLELIKKLSDLSLAGLVISATIGISVYIYTVLTKMVFSGERVFFGLILIFMVLQTVLSYVRRSNTVGYWEEVVKPNALRQKALEKAETAKLSEDKPFEPITSATANSTKLLFVENKTTKLE